MILLGFFGLFFFARLLPDAVCYERILFYEVEICFLLNLIIIRNFEKVRAGWHRYARINYSFFVLIIKICSLYLILIPQTYITMPHSILFTFNLFPRPKNWNNSKILIFVIVIYFFISPRRFSNHFLRSLKFY